MAEKNVYTALVPSTRDASDIMSVASGRYDSIDDTPLNLTHRGITASSFDPGRVTLETASLILDCNRLLFLPESICDMVHLRVLSVGNQLDLEQINEYAKPALVRVTTVLKQAADPIRACIIQQRFERYSKDYVKHEVFAGIGPADEPARDFS